MYDFNQLKSKGTSWHSSPMYTHPNGYKFCIAVYPNGWFVEMWVLMCRCTSEFDAILQWPAKVIITLQLLNQLRDNDHITGTKTVSLEETREGERVYVGVSYFTRTLIAHTYLELNADHST